MSVHTDTRLEKGQPQISLGHSTQLFQSSAAVIEARSSWSALREFARARPSAGPLSTERAMNLGERPKERGRSSYIASRSRLCERRSPLVLVPRQGRLGDTQLAPELVQVLLPAILPHDCYEGSGGTTTAKSPREVRAGQASPPVALETEWSKK